MEPAAQSIRAFPRYGWLAAVIPARARRFRVTDPELAETLGHAGADLVEQSPDVEITQSDDVRGEAPYAIVALSAHEPTGRARALRGALRLARSFAIRRRIRRSRRALQTCGYPRIEVLTWERRVALRSSESPTRRPVQLAHRFPLNAVVVGTHETATTTAFAASVVAVEAAVGHTLAAESLLVTASGVIVAPTSDVVLRVAVGPAALRIEEQRAALECLQAECPSHVVRERVPRVLAVGHAGVAVWSAESRLPGKTAPPLLTPTLYEDCVEFLAALYEIGHSGEASSAAEADRVANLCDEQYARAVRALGRKFDDSLAHLPRGFGHGDFWNGNLLIDDAARLSGVVDWPAAGPGRLPLLDLLHLRANSARELSRRNLGVIIVDDLLPLAQAGGDELLRRACRRIGIELTPGELVNLVGAYWLNAIARELADPDRDPDRPTDPYWRKVNVEHVVHAFSPPDRRRSALDRRQPATHPSDLVAVITDVDDLRDVEEEWRTLAEARGNPFITPEWFCAWLRHSEARERPFVPVLRREDGSLQGLVPLLTSERRRLRTLSFAGAEFGDYFHPVAAEDEDEVATAAATASLLARNRRDWAVLVADYVDDRAAWVRELLGGGEIHLAMVRYHDHPSIYRCAQLDGYRWEDFLATRSRNFRSQLGRKFRALERDHAVRFRQTANATELGGDMETLFDLHERRWGRRGSTVFRGDHARGFHLDFATAAMQRGWVRLWLLEVDEVPIAAWYGWRLGDRYSYYQAGFDPAWSRHSPGFLLLARTMRAAIEEGAERYEMLLGNEEYKSRFAPLERSAQTLVITPALHPARIAVTMDVSLRRLARRLPEGGHERLRQAASPIVGRWPIKTAP